MPAARRCVSHVPPLQAEDRVAHASDEPRAARRLGSRNRLACAQLGRSGDRACYQSDVPRRDRGSPTAAGLHLLTTRPRNRVVSCVAVLALRASGVAKHFETTRAVDGVDLELRRGRGARSARAERRRQDDAAADAARAGPAGRRVDRAARPAAWRRRLGFRSTGVAGFVEDPTFYPYLSGRANLELMVEFDRRADGPAIDDVLERVG